jgi:putative alpha-1,2-mannosidase
VFGALGFYPVNPVSGKYIIGTPMLEEAVIQLPDGKTFTIKAPRKEHNEIYIRSMRLNGKKYTKN